MSKDDNRVEELVDRFLSSLTKEELETLRQELEGPTDGSKQLELDFGEESDGD